MGKRGSNRGDGPAKTDFKLVQVLERYSDYRADQAIVSIQLVF